METTQLNTQLIAIYLANGLIDDGGSLTRRNLLTQNYRDPTSGEMFNKTCMIENRKFPVNYPNLLPSM